MANKIDFWFFLTNLTTSAFCKGDTRPAQEFLKMHVHWFSGQRTTNDCLAHDGQLEESLGDILLQGKSKTLAVYVTVLRNK